MIAPILRRDPITRIESELSASAISPEIAAQHFRYIEGDAAIELIAGELLEKVGGHGKQYATGEVSRILKRYECLRGGGWVFQGLDPLAHFEPMGWQVFKPFHPRHDANKAKPIKYESPAGIPTRAFISGDPAQWIAVHKDPAVPLTITEGCKKAASAQSHGIHAIGLPGIWGGTRKGADGIHRLIPELLSFCIPGRTWLIDFDVDTKASTRKAVAAATATLARALEAAGQIVKIVRRDHLPHKGTDDFIAVEGIEVYRDCLAKAQTLTQYRANQILSQDPPQAARETEGNYLPQLPPIQRGAVNWIAAGMGSGKTYRIGRDWVESWRATGGITIVLSPLNSLGQQTAKDWGLPHLHDHFPTREGQRILQAEIRQSGGIVACLNSVHRIKALIPDAPLLMVIDEAAQTLTDAAVGRTLGSAWADRWSDTIELLRGAEAVVLAEDGLDQATIDLVSELSGKPSTGIRHHRHQDPWQVTLYRGTSPSGYRAKLFEALKAGERILYLSTAQADCERLAVWADEQGIRYHRIDSTTNEAGAYRAFFEDPDPWLRHESPQLVILSPSGKTGLSIEGSITSSPWFDSVWGYFPGLDGDTALQMLGRYRPAVPRHILAAAFVTPDPGETPNPWAEISYLTKTAQQWGQLAGVDPSHPIPEQASIDRYLALRRTRAWAQKIQLADYLAATLTSKGHQVEVIRKDPPNREAAETWRRIRDDIALANSHLSAGIQLTPEQDPKWAHEVLSGIDTTHDQRLIARKVLTVERFPGLDWGSSQLWLEAIYGRKPIARGAALWAESGAVPTLRQADSVKAREILSKPLNAKHHLPTQSLEATLAAQFVPLLTRILAAGEVHPQGKTEAEIVAVALKYAPEIKRYWRMVIKESDSATATVNKLLRKFGILSERSRRISVNGSRAWVYRATITQTWRDLVAARQQALGIGGGTTLLNLYSDYKKQSCATPSDSQAGTTGSLSDQPNDPPDPLVGGGS